MRCATFTGGNLKGYWVEVAGVEGDSILVGVDEVGTSLPAPGDECVLMGNTENPLRQNLISFLPWNGNFKPGKQMPKPGNKNFKLHKQSENLRIFIYSRR